MQHRNLEELKAYTYLNCEIGMIYHEMAQYNGISDSVQNILYTLIAFGPECTQSDICKLTGISRQTINSAIRKLEREGVLYLKAGRKNKSICLTDQGHQLAERTVMPIIYAECEIFSGWSEEERKALFTLTKRYRDDFRRNMYKEIEK